MILSGLGFVPSGEGSTMLSGLTLVLGDRIGISGLLKFPDIKSSKLLNSITPIF